MATSTATPVQPLAPSLPRLHGDLKTGPIGDDGRRVVKNVRSGEFFALGQEEVFLLANLDGKTDSGGLRLAFEEAFGAELPEDELAAFLDLARSCGLVEEAARPLEEAGRKPTPEPRPDLSAPPPRQAAPPRRRQSLLAMRVKLFDPQALFAWLAPRLGFVWTWGFITLSAVLIGTAVAAVWGEGSAYFRPLSAGLGWRTLLLAWLALVITTTCHECAHGLTCTRFGGEVREMGFLLLFFTPCFYCNVSDSWLFAERRKQLAVSLAGPWCDLMLWSLGVLGWRVTQLGTTGNELAWVIASICGIRVLINANPLIPMDGYYVLSDALGIPNLRPRALAWFKAHLRWGLWGAERPAGESRGRLLLTYGAAAWIGSAVFLGLAVAGMARLLGSRSIWLGSGAAILLGTTGAIGLLHDTARGEAWRMLQERRGRLVLWGLGTACVVWVLALYPIQDRASGPVTILPATRVEIRAPASGFLRSVAADEGGTVTPGRPVVRLEIPDLASRLAQKRAECRESAAKLRLLEVGPRPEEVEEQRLRVARTGSLRDRARADLDRSRTALREQLAEMDGQVVQFQAEVERAATSLRRDRVLVARGALQPDQYSETERSLKVARAQLEQAGARRRARVAEGCLTAEAELARRAMEAEEAAAALRLLEAGSRPEEIEAERARSARLTEEVAYLEDLEARLTVVSPTDGVIITPRLKERIGRYFREGELIAEIDPPAHVVAEAMIPEEDVTRVRVGQRVLVKLRALPFQTFRCRVLRVAPAALTGEEQAAPAAGQNETARSYRVQCTLEDRGGTLRSGMSGQARVQLGPTPVGSFLSRRVLRRLRTEFWW